MLSDCDDDRLLIDDNNDISINEGENDINNATAGTENTNVVFDASREEGELVDEEMDNAQHDSEKTKSSGDSSKREKRPTTPQKQDGPSQKKMRVKTTPPPSTVTKHDKSTCVQSRAVQNEGDECPFDMEPGSSFTVQMTVVCRLEGANTLYVTTKWKDQELSGVLTDGVPPGFQNLMKKSVLRNQNGANFANTGDGDKSGNQCTPSKKRLGRNFQNDVRRRSARPAAENNNSNEDVDEELDVANDSRPASGTGSVTLTEVAEVKSLHECPYEGCFYRFEKGVEMDYHVNIVHKVKAVMRESICSQTEISSLRRASVGTETDPIIDDLTDLQKDSMKQLFMASTSSAKAEIKEETSKRTVSPFSDISEPDDSSAIRAKDDAQSDSHKQSSSGIEKTEPSQSSGVATVNPLQGNPVLESQIHSSVSSLMGASRVNPLSSNGIFSSPISSTNPFQTPSRMHQQEHKIHQLKQEEPSGSNSSLAPKPMASPAQHRSPYSLSMGGPHSSHHLMQSPLTAQAMQMFHLTMGRGYPAPNVPPLPPDQLAQYAALHANLQPGTFGNMFPK